MVKLSKKFYTEEQQAFMAELHPKAKKVRDWHWKLLTYMIEFALWSVLLYSNIKGLPEWMMNLTIFYLWIRIGGLTCVTALFAIIGAANTSAEDKDLKIFLHPTLAKLLSVNYYKQLFFVATTAGLVASTGWFVTSVFLMILGLASLTARGISYQIQVDRLNKRIKTMKEVKEEIEEIGKDA